MLPQSKVTKLPSLKECLVAISLVVGVLWRGHFLPWVSRTLQKAAFNPQQTLIVIGLVTFFVHNHYKVSFLESRLDSKEKSTDTTVVVVSKRAPSVQWGTKNEAAPVSAKYMNKEMVQDYVGRFSKIAVAEMEKFGVPASISLAQGLIESRAGHSLVAIKCNNHFGMKCWSKKHRGCCMKFHDDNNNDSFKHFNSPWESWRSHSKLLSKGRYAKLKKHGRDYRKWAFGLKAAGYATDRTYAEKLIGIIEKYELYKYDR